MMNDYVFFDVETPNRRHDRICSIGIVRTDANGKKQYSREILVNPEVGFDEDNMNIHHIAPAAIKGMQSFDDVWSKDLSSVFSDAVLVAHNASFDMSVLGKTLSAYNIEKPNFNYNCTYSLAKRNIPALPDYHLPTVSDYFGIKIGTHHNALDDAMACNDIFWSMMLQWGSEMCCCIPYVWADAAMTERLSENCSQAMTDLYGIAIGVSLSGSIEQEELVGFKDWMVRNKTSQSKPFFRQCYALLEAVLADGRVTNDERKEILALTRPFVMNEHNKL